MQLLQNEEIISISDDYSVILTTHRISQEHKSFADSNCKSIMLEHITSCGLFRKRSWLLLGLTFIAIVVAVITYINGDYYATGPAAGLAFLIFVFFFLFQWSAIKITSPSTTIHVNVLGMNQVKVIDFIYKVEEAKHQRLTSLMQKVS